MRVLHAIHDFLPRHQAGSEIYCFELCRALQARGVGVHVLCAEYDPAREHGMLAWRAHDGLGVTEVINNWAFTSFAESYASPLLGRRLGQVLDIVQPDVLHIHNLLNLSFDLPALARERGIPVAATLHDYTLVCPSGGQRVHLAEQHVCHTIDTERCSRCFPQHPLHAQLVFGRTVLARPGGGRAARLLNGARRRLPRVVAVLHRVAAHAAAPPLGARDLDLRLARARSVFDAVDLFVAPSPALAAEYRRLGLPAAKLCVSDYGFPPLGSRGPQGPLGSQGPHRPRGGPRRERRPGLLRVGFAGTLVWHKGVHVLIDAMRRLPPDGYELLVFGDPGVFPDYVADLRRRSAGLAVRFLGRFDRAAAPAVYAQMDVLAVPSLWPENSPLVIHEAFQAGLPVVGSRLGGTADLVADGTNGLLYEAFSAADLAAALRRLLEEPGLLDRLAAGVPAVKSIDQDAGDWEERYRRLAPPRGGARGGAGSAAR
jgi:glycosyltransferase involved in cell wall biosynthesis